MSDKLLSIARDEAEFKKWRRQLEFERRMDEEEFEGVYAKMSVEERTQLFMLNCNGLWDQRTNTVLMGRHAMERFLNFKTEMKNKYGAN